MRDVSLSSLTVLCGLLQGRGRGEGRGCVLAIALQVTHRGSGRMPAAYPGMQRLLLWTVGRGTAH